MVTLWLVIFIIVFIIGNRLAGSYNFEDGGVIMMIISIILIVVACIIEIGISFCLADSIKAEEKIAMYQEENSKIESQINELVEKYMDYESETLSDFKPESSITLVSLYPELKSDTLVQTQITTYTENNNIIKELKEMLIDRSVYRWMLYFGK